MLKGSAGILYVSPGVRFGLNAFGAYKDGTDPNYTNKMQYTAYDLSTYYYTNIPKVNIAYSLQINGQYSRDSLFLTEGMYVGSFYTVRGFRNVGILADTAIYARNNFTYNLGKISKLASGFDIIPHFDIGYVKQNAIYGVSDTIGSVGIGLNYTHKLFRTSLTYSSAVIVPQAYKAYHATQDGSGILYLTIDTTF